MKKVILVLFAIMMASAAYAQKFYAGGSIGMTSNSNTKTSTFTVKPELGYVINDKFAVGAELLLSAYTGGNTIGFSPYVRYTMFKVGKVAFFSDGAFLFSKAKNADATWEIGIYPGISIPLDNKISFVAHLGELSYSSGNQMTFSLTNAVATGLYFHF